MDYKKFFMDVVGWIHQANHAASKYGLNQLEFWEWVAKTSGQLCFQYGNHPLAIRQMIMLCEWLEDAANKAKG